MRPFSKPLAFTNHDNGNPFFFLAKILGAWKRCCALVNQWELLSPLLKRLGYIDSDVD